MSKKYVLKLVTSSIASENTPLQSQLHARDSIVGPGHARI